LFHFTFLDDGDITNNPDKQMILSFRRMKVNCVCLLSHIFAEEKVPTETINVLMRLFLSLSSCRTFRIHGEKNQLNQYTDDGTSLSGRKDKPMMGN
jgi:hypothetical protein